VIKCQSCGRELAANEEVCTICEAAILNESNTSVFKTDSPIDAKEDRLVSSFFWENDAECARILLESNNIKAKIKSNGLAAANPLLANATGGIELFVSMVDFDRAFDIIKQNQKEKADDVDVWCPNCESTDVSKYRLSRTLKMIAVITLGIIAILMAKSYKCNKCGYSWR
jgi:predicted RNA-binding Zn-ribbon protein involved in translation (DUF1610 family)